MNFPFYIARRYLFSKKSHNAINIISMVSVCGVVVATAALVCALSVLNGFSDLVATLFSNFDPELKIDPQTGKVFDPTTPEIETVRSMPEIDFFCEVLQENALIKYGDRQKIGIIKGVDDSFNQITRLDSVLIDGEFKLHEDVVDYATLGIGVAVTLGTNAGFTSPLEIYAPKRDEKINLSNPATSFSVEYAYVSGVFRLNEQVYDENYTIIPLSLARSLFKYEKEVSEIEIKLKKEANLQAVKEQIRQVLGKNFTVKDRFEQQEASFKMMQIEKWVIFLILIFILTIALFNLVGSLSMLMIEKQKDVHTLRNLGANDTLIRRVFLFEGWMISGFGALIGIILGLTLCLLQLEFGLIKLGTTEGAFIIDNYPVRIEVADILIIFITVLSIGFLSAWYTVRFLGKRWLQK